MLTDRERRELEDRVERSEFQLFMDRVVRSWCSVMPRGLGGCTEDLWPDHQEPNWGVGQQPRSIPARMNVWVENRRRA